MLLHLIPNEKFTDSIILFMKKNYQEGMHQFIVYESGLDLTKYKGKNVKYLMFDSNYSQCLDEACYQAEKIFIHSFWEKKIINYFCHHKKLLKKSCLIFWGADLYNDIYYLQKHPGLHIKARIDIMKKRSVVKNVPLFMTFTCTDYDKAKSWYHANGRQFDCLYPSNLDKTTLDKLYKKKQEKLHKRINILVGNSATVTNKHLEAFDFLSKFKEEDIKIICPLSYGDNEYAKKVIEYGEGLFSNKFVALQDYMPIEEYSELLSTVDIALFNYMRQQGTANIEILSYFGAKLFIRTDSALWGHYVVRDKCEFYDITSIPSLNFDEFIGFGGQEHNRQYFSKIWDDKYIKYLWNIVIEAEC